MILKMLEFFFLLFLKNMRFDTVEAILKVLGFRLSVELIKTEIKQSKQLEILK